MGTLSYHSMGAEQPGQPERPPSERRSGTLATTTFRKLPTARAGPRTRAASIIPLPRRRRSPRRAGLRPGNQHRRTLRLRLGRLVRGLFGSPLLDRVLERDEEVVLVRRRIRGDLALHLAREDELDQRLVERLHVVVLAVGHRVGDLVGPVLLDEVADTRVRDHDLDRRHAPAVRFREQALADHAAQRPGDDRADLLVLRRRELNSRPSVSAASRVCSVEKTRWPDSEAWSATWADSASRARR